MATSISKKIFNQSMAHIDVSEFLEEEDSYDYEDEYEYFNYEDEIFGEREECDEYSSDPYAYEDYMEYRAAQEIYYIDGIPDYDYWEYINDCQDILNHLAEKDKEAQENEEN